MNFKENMMENMMGKMSSEEKKEMMGSMMNCRNSTDDKMGSSEKEKQNDSCFNSMEMCKKMMSSISQSSEIATFATPEVRQLFEEWVQQVDDEILNLIKENSPITPEEISEKLKISKDSVIYFLSRLAQKGKIDLNIGKAEK